MQRFLTTSCQREQRVPSSTGVPDTGGLVEWIAERDGGLRLW